MRYSLVFCVFVTGSFIKFVASQEQRTTAQINRGKRGLISNGIGIGNEVQFIPQLHPVEQPVHVSVPLAPHPVVLPQPVAVHPVESGYLPPQIPQQDVGVGIIPGAVSDDVDSESVSIESAAGRGSTNFVSPNTRVRFLPPVNFQPPQRAQLLPLVNRQPIARVPNSFNFQPAARMQIPPSVNLRPTTRDGGLPSSYFRRYPAIVDADSVTIESASSQLPGIIPGGGAASGVSDQGLLDSYVPSIIGGIPNRGRQSY